jgi:UDP-N-acetylglucosamine 2-epimerase
MKVLTVVGARPQFVKAWPVSRALRAAGIEEALVHSGQHYDDAMSQVFFDELGLDMPVRHLGIGSGMHGEQTGRMMIALEQACLELAPDCVIVYGDTNTTLAGAIVACKLRIPLAHIEAGLRSWNREMPEEHNRILSDHCSDMLLCPTQTAVENLKREGLVAGVHLVGDVMYDAALHFGGLAREKSAVLSELGLERGGYYLATIHRPQNADDPVALGAIVDALVEFDAPVVLPVHPRTRAQLGGEIASRLRGSRVLLTPPRGYLDMLMLEQFAKAILTDSGGVQKEAYYFGVPCLTLRTETEWTETVASGWNVLVGTSTGAIVSAAMAAARPAGKAPPVFGDGHAAEKIAALLPAIRLL